jgi:hypothetical protein
MKDLKDTLNEQLMNEGFGKDIQMPNTNHCIIFTDTLSGTISVYGFRNVDELCQMTDTDIDYWNTIDIENHLKAGEVCYTDARGGVKWNDNPRYFDSMIMVVC